MSTEEQPAQLEQNDIKNIWSIILSKVKESYWLDYIETDKQKKKDNRHEATY